MHGAAERALGVHRVLEPCGVLPQAARRLDADPAIGPDEVRIAVVKHQIVDQRNLPGHSYLRCRCLRP